jgi:hypothetical protein
VSVTVTVWVNDPLVAVIVSRKVPVGGFLGTMIVSVEEADTPLGFTMLGTMVPITPFGSPETVNVTGAENPLSEVTLRVTLADWDLLRLTEPTEVPTEKSVILTVSTVVLVTKPDDAVIVNGNVLGVVALETVTVTFAITVVPGFRDMKVGRTDAVTPVGAPEV